MFTVKQKMLIARTLNRVVMTVRTLVGQDASTHCRRRGIEWVLDLNEGIDLSIYLLGAYEPRLLAAYQPLLLPGAVVWDIGANIGAHTLHFARLAGSSGQVFAFEPSNFAYGKLTINLQANPDLASRVRAAQIFLVDHPAVIHPQTVYASWPVGSITGQVDREHLGRSTDLTAAVPMTGDDFCRQQGLVRLDFVKLDVDGHELSVLEGMQETLARFHPTLMMEIAPFVLDRQSPTALAKLLDLLDRLGYRLQAGGRTVPLEATRLRARIPSGGSLNVILRPNNRSFLEPARRSD